MGGKIMQLRNEIENKLLDLPIEVLQESKDFAASIQDCESFSLLNRIIMVKNELNKKEK